MSINFLDLAQVPADQREEVERWQRALETVTPPITRAVAQVARDLGVSAATALRKYYGWQKRGWRALVDASRHPQFGLARAVELHPETGHFYHDLCLQNGRKDAPAYRKLIRLFNNGAAIPGVPHGTSRHRLPEGWSKSNFRKYTPTPFEKKAARIGIKAAADCRPLVFTTRVGLEVGQYFMFDDMWHDFEVVTLGSRQRSRLLQLHAHDLYSACQFARGLKPRLRREDGTATNLSEDEMLFLVAHVLGTFGYREAGTTLIVEAGTAVIREALAQKLYDLSGGKVRVHVGEVTSERAFAGQYLGRGKGNFRFKASLESLGNLIHNETADMIEFPGQTGFNSRLNAPEELAGRQKTEDQLLAAMAILPMEVLAKLKHSFLEVTQAKWLVESVMDRINRRTVHELEGFVEAGLTTTDYETPAGTFSEAQWLGKLAGLSPEQQAAVTALATTVPRKCSPMEVFARGSRKLTRFRGEQIALMLYHARRKEPVTVNRRYLVEFEDAAISPSPLRYLAERHTPGDKFDCVVNPCAPWELFIYAADGRWLGVLQHWGRVRKDDTEALHRQIGAAEKIKGELLKPLADAGREQTRTLLENTQHNNEVFSDLSEPVKPVLNSRKEAAKKATALKSFTGDVSDFLTEE